MSGRLDKTDGSPSPRGYIRGGGGVDVGARRVAAVLVVAGVAILLTLAIVLAVEAAGQNSRIDRLHASGVPVSVRVTGCLAMASGTGITESGYQCRGTFPLRGHRYEEIIGGTSDQHATGEMLRGVAVPDDPSILSTAASVAAMRSSWTAYGTAAALFLSALLTAGLAGWRYRSARRRAG